MIIKKAKNQKDFFMCMKVRGIVFVDEQGVTSDIEIDETDQTCDHYLAIIDDMAVGTIRAIKNDDYTKLGRICVLKEYRAQGVGKRLVEYVINDIKGDFKLGSQLHATKFYEKLGFISIGETYMEANIEHIDMILKGSA